MESNFERLDAYQIGKLIKENKLNPLTLLEFFIDLYKKSKKDTQNSFCDYFIKNAYKEAELSRKRQINDSRLSIFDGIPTGWKDVIDIEGCPAYGGSKIIKKIRFNGKVKDAEIVRNAKSKGIVSLGKTSTVEFAFGGLGINNSCSYPTNQMISGNYCPGGSSSGSAAAVYSGLIPFSIGTDTAGSVRIPSAWHSLIGFKPTYASISCKGILPLSKSYDTVGTICKSVRDTKILFNLLSNNNYKYPDISNKKIVLGFVEDFTFDSMLVKDKEAFLELIEYLSKIGVKVKKIKIPEFKKINNLIHSKGSIVNYEAWNYWRSIIVKNLANIDRNVSSRFALGRNIDNLQIKKIKREIMGLKKRVYAKFDGIDSFFMPTLGFKPPSIREMSNEKKYIKYNTLALNSTRIANIFNLCAITMPIKKGNWLSFSLLQKENYDVKLLCLAALLEKKIKKNRINVLN